jgi:thiamine kinase-like enzyme
MGDPRRYILKVGTEDSLAQNFARNIRPFRREVAAYQLLRSCTHPTAPRCYLSSATPDGSSGILLLEEILNGQNYDQLRGLTWPQLTSTAQAVARVHARFWNSPTLRKAKGLPLHQYMHARQVGQHLPRFVRWTRLPASTRSIFNKLPRQVEAALARLRKRPITLVHGDLRSDNIFFGKRSVRLIDWGLALAGNALFDLARVTGGSSQKPLSLLQHIKLLDLWHRELVRRGVRGYPIHHAWQDYRDAALLTLTIPVTNAPTLATLSKRGQKLAQTITKRFLFLAREMGSS